MQKLSLEATARELLERARGSSGGRAATTVIGGHEKVLRQTAAPSPPRLYGVNAALMLLELSVVGH